MASALSCSCAPPVTDDYEESTKYTTYTGSGDTHSSEESEVFNTSYKKATPLFRQIEKENWTGVLLFLNTGRWNNSIFTTNAYMRNPGEKMQAKTWVTAYDRNGEPEWSQLPLHAAISYSAPCPVIQKLVELYPRAIQCTDNEGMLPIHLAYGFGAPDNVLAILLERFPSSINEKGLGGRYPYECCELGPNKVRGRVYKIVSEQLTRRVTEEIHTDWKRFVMALGLKKEDVSNKTLHEFLLELIKDRKKLQRAKKHSDNASNDENAAKTSKSPIAFSPRKGGGRRAVWARDKSGKKYSL